MRIECKPFAFNNQCGAMRPHPTPNTFMPSARYGADGCFFVL